MGIKALEQEESCDIKTEEEAYEQDDKVKVPIFWIIIGSKYSLMGRGEKVKNSQK